MRLAILARVERMRPGPLRDRLLALAKLANSALSGADDRAVSGRVAMYAFGIRIASAFIALGSQVLLARWMGEHQYGIFVVVWVAAILVGGFGAIGFQISPLRFIPEYIERKKTGLLRGIVIGARLYGLAAATVIALIGVGLLLLFQDFLGEEHVMPFFLAAICLPMLALGEIQDGIARAFTWSRLAFIPTFIGRPLTIIFTMWAAMQLGAEATAATAMWATVAACYLVALAQGLALQRRIRHVVPPGKALYRPAMWIVITAPMFLVEGFYNLMTNVDILAVGALLDPDRAAVYFATVKTLALVHFVYFAVRAAAANRFSKYHYSGDRIRMASFLRDTLHWTFWPSLAIGLGLLIVGRPLLSLFGPTFTDGYPLLFIFVIGLVVRASVGPAESILTMAGQQRICALVYASVFTLNLALNLILIPLWGISGAAIATSFSLLVEAFFLALLVYTRLGLRSWIGFALAPRHAAEAG
ncbi:MAG: lipopolysaccharide biosynthesis protein [Alphaproteobacteria bacterium]